MTDSLTATKGGPKSGYWRPHVGREGGTGSRKRTAGVFIGVPASAGIGKTDQFHYLMQPTGAPVRGVPISYDDPRIPDTVYHVTTNLSAVKRDALLKARGVGGLGGDKNDQIVSLTIDKGIAEQLAKDLRFAIEFSREFGPSQPEHVWDDATKKWRMQDRQTGAEVPDDVLLARAERMVAYLSAHAAEEGWEFGGDANVATMRYNPHDWQIHYFQYRSSATSKIFGYNQPGHLRNPIIFTGWDALMLLDPANVGVISIPRANLNTGALITNFDLGKNHLEEVRIYGDLPLDGALYNEKGRGRGYWRAPGEERRPGLPGQRGGSAPRGVWRDEKAGPGRGYWHRPGEPHIGRAGKRGGSAPRGAKHYGPGPHPGTGTPQAVHGGDFDAAIQQQVQDWLERHPPVAKPPAAPKPPTAPAAKPAWAAVAGITPWGTDSDFIYGFDRDAQAVAEAALTEELGPKWFRRGDPLITDSWIDEMQAGRSINSEDDSAVFRMMRDKLAQYYDYLVERGEWPVEDQDAEAAFAVRILSAAVTGPYAGPSDYVNEYVERRGTELRERFIADYLAMEKKFAGNPSRTTKWVAKDTVLEETTRSGVKHAIVRDLSQATGLPYEEVNAIIKEWSNTSNKSFGASVIQAEGARLLGGRMDGWQQQRAQSYAARIDALATALLQDDYTHNVGELLATRAGRLIDKETEIEYYKRIRSEAKNSRNAIERFQYENIVKTAQEQAATIRKEIAVLLRDYGLDRVKQQRLTRQVEEEYAAKVRKIMHAVLRRTDKYLGTKNFNKDGYIRLFRGIKVSNATIKRLGLTGADYEQKRLTVKRARSVVPRNALESWSIDPETANKFGNLIISAMVPVSRVLSTALTGWGASNEYEFIVGGDNSQDEVWAWLKK